MQDDFIASLALANCDAFVSDLRSGRAQDELAKNLRDTRAAQDVDHQIESFFEDLELGRTGAAPARLRSERRESEGEWKPGDDPNFGLETDLSKRHGGKLREPARVEKSASGWTKEFAEDGSLLRAYGPGISREVFAT